MTISTLPFLFGLTFCLGFMPFSVFKALTLLDLMAVVAFGTAILKRQLFFNTNLLIFGALISTSLFFQLTINYTVQGLEQLLQLIFLFFVFSPALNYIFRNEQSTYYFLIGLLCSAIFYSAYSIYLHNENLISLNGAGRFIGLYGGVNKSAWPLVAPLIVSLWMLFQDIRFWPKKSSFFLKLFAVCCLCLSCYALLFLFKTRSIIFGIILGYLFLIIIISANARRTKYLNFLIVGFLLTLLTSFSWLTGFMHFLRADDILSNFFDGRGRLIVDTWHALVLEFKFWGHGVGKASEVTETGQSVHLVPLLLLYEVGIIPTIILSLFVFELVYRSLFYANNSDNSRLQSFAKLSVVLTVTIIIILIFNTAFYQRELWLHLGFVSILIARNDLKRVRTAK